MLTNWRFWVLAVLLLGPPAVYIGLGAAWLLEHRWGIAGFLAWTAAAVAFGVLSVRWTKAGGPRPAVVPLDWSAPETFAPRDREAWALVRAEADAADALSQAQLVDINAYAGAAQRLAEALSTHYRPGAAGPVEHVPVVELLTAVELAAEDLVRMIREIPGGDLVTFAHWKAAVQAANFVGKANEYYNYLLPLFQPMQGLMRLGATKLMTQPAWRGMQQNILRWFFRAYVQRLGVHLIETYSGRLAIGAGEYRRLTRKPGAGGSAGGAAAPAGSGPDDPPITLVVAGARGAGKSTLIDALAPILTGGAGPLRELLTRHRTDPALAEVLARAHLVEAEDYTTRGDKDGFLDRHARRAAVHAAAQADLLVLVVDGRRDDFRADARFVADWNAWYAAHPGLEPPPALVVMTGTDRLDPAAPPDGPAPTAAGDRVAAFREAMPDGFAAKVLALGLAGAPAEELAERLAPALATLAARAGKSALIRHLHRRATQSKALRVLGQVGRQGQRALGGVGSLVASRFRRKGDDDAPPAADE